MLVRAWDERKITRKEVRGPEAVSRVQNRGPRAAQNRCECPPARTTAHYRRQMVDRRAGDSGGRSSSWIRSSLRGCELQYRGSSRKPAAPAATLVRLAIELNGDAARVPVPRGCLETPQPNHHIRGWRKAPMCCVG